MSISIGELGDGTLGGGTLGNAGGTAPPIPVPDPESNLSTGLESIPHLALPLRITNNRYAINEQDTQAEIADCVRAICLTPKEFRPENPAFGIRDPTFATMPINSNDIINQINEWESRADVDVTIEMEADGVQRVNIKILHPEEDEEA